MLLNASLPVILCNNWLLICIAIYKNKLILKSLPWSTDINKMSSTFMCILALVCGLFITSVTSKSLLPSYWSKEVVTKRKNVEKACVPFCKVFSTVCNYGECRQKLETDCEWYCECPPDCAGRFCEKLIKPGDTVSTSNPNESNVVATIPNITLAKETTKVPPMENINGSASKVAEVSICPPEMTNTRLNGTNDKILTSGDINNSTENGKNSSNNTEEMNKKTLAVLLNLTKSHIISDTKPAQSVHETAIQQSVPMDAQLQTGTTVAPNSVKENITGTNTTFPDFSSIERTGFTSTENSTKHTSDLASEKNIRTETVTLVSLLKDSPIDLQSFDVNQTSSKSAATTTKPIITQSHVTSERKHDFEESEIETSEQNVELLTVQKTVTVATIEQKQISSDVDFVQNNFNTFSNTISVSAEDRDTVTISISNVMGKVSSGGSKLEEHTVKADQMQTLGEKSAERESSPFISNSMPDQLSSTNITIAPKTNDQSTDRPSINSSISPETTLVKKDEIKAVDIEMRTIQVNLTVRPSEYSSTNSVKISNTGLSPITTPSLNTQTTAVDQPISDMDIRTVDLKVVSGENKIDTGESVEVQNNFEKTTFKMILSSLRHTANSSQSDKINKSEVETTTINTISDVFTRRDKMTTVNQQLKSKEKAENFNVATGNNMDNDFKVRLKGIQPESNNLAQSKTYDSQELVDTGKDFRFP